MLETITVWFTELGAQYGVNPLIFGAIYVGAIPLFTLAVAWVISNHKKGKSIVIPTITASLCFISSYLYLIFTGENVPGWVYVAIVLILGYGGYATVSKIRKKIIEIDHEAGIV